MPMTLDDAENLLRSGLELVIRRDEAFFAPPGRHYLRQWVDPDVAERFYDALGDRYYTRNGQHRVLTSELRPNGRPDLCEPSRTSNAETRPRPIELNQPYYSMVEVAQIVGVVGRAMKQTVEAAQAEYGLVLGQEKSLYSGYTCTVVYRSRGLCRFLRERYGARVRLP